MLPVILALTALGTVAPAPAVVPSQDPTIRVWLDKRGYVEPMDRVRAYVRTNVDGYVVILHAEPSGRVRVLFPVDPDDDAFVRAGKDYEIRGRGDREAFTVYDGSGPGVVLAAVSRDPLQFNNLALNRHWDYRAAAFSVGNDPEADLLAVVQQITGGGWFDYDVARYEIASNYIAAASSDDQTVHLSFYDTGYQGHYWSGGVGFSIGLGWYDPWYNPFYWSSCWDYWYCGYDAWYRPYPGYYGYPYYPIGYYPVAYYPPRYYVPGGSPGARHVFAAGGSPYAFKSHDDRFGLQPRSVEARRRTAGASGYASTAATNPASSGRRTVGATAGQPARVAPGSLTPRRRYETAPDGSAVLPPISGRRPATTTTAPGAPRGTADAATSGRRTVTPARLPEWTNEVLRRSTESLNTSGRTTTTSDQTRTPSGLRLITPRSVGQAPAPGSRSSSSTVGSGHTTYPSSGTLERRTPTRSASPPSSTRNAPTTRSAPPPRTVSPPRAAPSRPPTRVSPPRSAPSRPPSSPTRRRG
jgi:Domain of unknown function (DUF4384)